MSKLRVGEIVHFVTTEQWSVNNRSAPKAHLAAIVVIENPLRLLIFTNGEVISEHMVFFADQPDEDQTGEKDFSWHFPERT